MSTSTSLEQAQAEIPDLFVAREHKPAVDLKGSVFTLTVLRLQQNNLAQIENEVKERIAQGPRFFENAPVVIDVEALKEQDLTVDFAQLTKILRDNKLVPVGLRHGNQDHQEAAVAAGLALMKGGSIRDLPPATGATPATETAPAAKPAPARTEPAAQAASKAKTKVIYQPIRSGQQIYAKGGDLIVLAAVNAGAEIVADGNIHVYAPLRGRALAGVMGDTEARIFCQSLEAELVSVGGHYRVFEDNIPPDVHRQNVQIYLDGEQLIIEPLK